MSTQDMHDTNGHTSIDSYERYVRHLSRQVIISEKRNRTTDVLPAIESEVPVGKLSARQASHLRDENRRLHQEVDELQRRVALAEQEIATLHHAHPLEIEQYQGHLRELMEELNQKQQASQEMEQRYQELYHSFHDAVEEEAAKLVTEAAQTMVLSPDYTPPILHDVVRTLEFQVKQTEDQSVAEIMALMRQAQRKNELLEQELAQERENLANERQKTYAEQKRIREQADLRYKMIETSLRTGYAAILTILATSCLLVFALIEVTLFTYFKLSIYWSIFIPMVVCAALAFVITRFIAHARYYRPPAKKK